MQNRLLESFLKDTLTLDCPYIELVQNKDSSEPHKYQGPGTIFQDKDGQFQLKMYCNGKPPLFESFPLNNFKAGEIIAKSEYFSLAAKSIDGTTWKADRIIPRKDINYELDGYLVLGIIRELYCENQSYIDSKYNMVKIRFRGDIRIPCNTYTKIEKYVDGQKKSYDTLINISKFQINDFLFQIEKENRWLKVEILSTKKQITNSFITRITEAFQFLLGRLLISSFIEITQNNIEKTILRSNTLSDEKTYQKPPISIDMHSSADEAWMLFEKYLSHVIQYDEEKKWSPLFRLIYSILKTNSASLEAQALSISVAIEGLLKLEFSALTGQNENEKKQIQELESFINDSDNFDNNFKLRMQGTLQAMLRPRAKDRLRVLSENGLIDKKFIAAWEKIRNPSTHADSEYWNDTQTHLNLCNTSYVLFLQLIFIAIGYSGKYIDYSVAGYPEVMFYINKA